MIKQKNTTEKILKYIKRDDFYKFFSRNICLQINELFSCYSVKDLYKYRGIHFSQFSTNRDGFSDCYSLKNEQKIVNGKIKKLYQKSNSINDYFERKALPVFLEYILFTRRMNKKYSAKQHPSHVILKDFDDFVKINSKFVSNLWLIYLSDEIIDDIFKKELLKYLKQKKEESRMREYILVATTPLLKTAITKEHEELLEIATGKDKDTRSIKIKIHWKKWLWFPCYNPCDKAYDISVYKKELKKYPVAIAKEELKRIKNEHSLHKKKFTAFISDIQSNKKLLKATKMINAVCFYREYRNDLRREGLYLIGSFYEAIGNLLRVSSKEICYLTVLETRQSIIKEKLEVKREVIKRRIKEYALFGSTKYNILIDDERTINEITETLRNKIDKNDVIQGQSACGGVGKGRVCVISHIDKLQKFQKGEVLVASMTAPDYVSAMKKAAAIITDEGGITCHAAIVSREYKIPCVVGTKIATQVLKDGDLVEVDAEKGIVKILEK